VTKCKSYILVLGGLKTNKIHRKYITYPSLFKKLDLRTVEPGQYIEELIKRAKSIGFTGVALIHPKHVAIANRIFRLTVEEVTYHRALIESYEEGIKKGLGAVRFRDAMIDQAMYERSMELLSNQT
jgi:citrate lyase beta subunit